MKIVSPEYPIACMAVDVIFVNPDGQILRTKQMIQQGKVVADKFCKDWSEFNKELGSRKLPACLKGELVETH